MALTIALANKDNKDSLILALDATPKTPYFCPHCGARVHRRSYGHDKASYACYRREVHTSPTCLALVGHADRIILKTDPDDLVRDIRNPTPRRRRRTGSRSTSPSNTPKAEPPTAPPERALSSLAQIAELDYTGQLEPNSVFRNNSLLCDLVLHPEWENNLPPFGENLVAHIAKAVALDYDDENKTISFSMGALTLIIAFDNGVVYAKTANQVFTKTITEFGRFITPPSTPFVWIEGDWTATETPNTYRSNYFGPGQIFIPKVY